MTVPAADAMKWSRELARKGFVVVAVIHPGDNAQDHSRLGTLSNLYGRPIQISEAITATLNDPMLAPFVNAGQVGVIGYSAGGETALILSGGGPLGPEHFALDAQVPSTIMIFW